MKRTITILLFLPILFSCKHTDRDPQAVSKAFVNALLKRNYDEAAKYASKESQSALEMLKSADNMYRQFGKEDPADIVKELRGKKLDYTEPEMDGTDRAKLTILTDGKEKMPLILVKQGEAWKVAFDKATIMDTERNTPVAPRPNDANMHYQYDSTGN